MKIAVVIPAYNEADTIGSVIGGIKEVETIIVVDDSSSDATAEIAISMGAVVVRHETNRGYDGALQSGFEKASQLGVDAVVTMDADGEADPGILEALIEPLRNGESDLVLGIRPRPARIAEALFNLYGKLRFGVNDLLCGLKGYRMELFHARGRFDGMESIGTELALYAMRNKANVKCIMVPVSPRKGRSRFGSGVRANLRILRALFMAIYIDFKEKE